MWHFGFLPEYNKPARVSGRGTGLRGRLFRLVEVVCVVRCPGVVGWADDGTEWQRTGEGGEMVEPC